MQINIDHGTKVNKFQYFLFFVHHYINLLYHTNIFVHTLKELLTSRDKEIGFWQSIISENSHNPLPFTSFTPQKYPNFQQFQMKLICWIAAHEISLNSFKQLITSLFKLNVKLSKQSSTTSCFTQLRTNSNPADINRFRSHTGINVISFL